MEDPWDSVGELLPIGVEITLILVTLKIQIRLIKDQVYLLIKANSFPGFMQKTVIIYITDQSIKNYMTLIKIKYENIIIFMLQMSIYIITFII